MLEGRLQFIEATAKRLCSGITEEVGRLAKMSKSAAEQCKEAERHS